MVKQVKMPSQKLSSNALQKYLGARPMVIAFTAPWCGHCTSLKEEYDHFHDAMKASMPHVVVARYDAAKHQAELANFAKESHGTTLSQVVRSYPTIIYFEAQTDSSKPARASMYQGKRTVEDMQRTAHAFFNNS